MHWSTKEALVALYLSQRDERWREHVRAVVEGSPRTAPPRRPLLVFDALAAWMATENSRGCGFVNAHAELPDAGQPGRHAIQAQKEWVLTYLRELVEAAHLRNPGRLAESCSSCWRAQRWRSHSMWCPALWQAPSASPGNSSNQPCDALTSLVRIAAVSSSRARNTRDRMVPTAHSQTSAASA